jgi:hypothetical protein
VRFTCDDKELDNKKHKQKTYSGACLLVNSFSYVSYSDDRERGVFIFLFSMLQRRKNIKTLGIPIYSTD